MNKSNEKVTEKTNSQAEDVREEGQQETNRKITTSKEILAILSDTGDEKNKQNKRKSQVGGIFSVNGKKTKYLGYDHQLDKHLFAPQVNGKYHPSNNTIGLSYQDIKHKNIVRVVGDLKYIPEEDEKE